MGYICANKQKAVAGLVWNGDDSASFGSGCAMAPAYVRDRLERYNYLPMRQSAGQWFDGTLSSRPTFCVGGDHGVTLEHFDKVKSAKSLLWLDAHPDLLDGEHYGCVLRTLLTRHPNLASRTVIAGVRAIEKPEQAFIIKHRITPLLARSLVCGRGGLRLAEILGNVLTPPVYVSIDMDVFDPSCAPGVTDPAAGGLGLYDVVSLLELVAKMGMCGGDLVEVNPTMEHRITVELAVRLLVELAAILTGGVR